MGQPIGELDVIIQGDYSQLDQDFAEVTSNAAAAGQKVAESFNLGAKGADSLLLSLDDLSAAARTTKLTADEFASTLDKLIDEKFGATTAEESARSLELNAQAMRDTATASKSLDDFLDGAGFKSFTEQADRSQDAMRRWSEQASAETAAARTVADGLEAAAKSMMTEAAAATQASGATAGLDAALSEFSNAAGIKGAADAQAKAFAEFAGSAGQVLPAIKAIEPEVESLADKLKDFGGTARDLGGILSATITVPLAGVSAALIKVGTDFDEVSHTIRARTGLTGDALAQMNASFDRLASNVPNKLGDITAAMVTLETRLHVTGPALEALGTQMLNLSRITGEQIAPMTDAAAKAFQRWSIDTANQSAALDKLYYASTQTGASVTAMLGTLRQFAPALQEVGFSFDQSVALIAKFDQAGLNTQRDITALQQAILKLGKAGIADPVEALQVLVDKIKNAGSVGEANAIGLKVFGRGALDMVDAILKGKLSVDDFVKSMQGHSGAVNQAAADTLSFTDKLKLLSNQIETAARPAGEAFIATLEGVLNQSKPAIEAVSSLAKAFADLSPEVRNAILAVGGVAAVTGPALLGIGALASGVAGLITKLSESTTAWSLFVGGLRVAEITAATGAIYLLTDAFLALNNAERGVNDADKALYDQVQKNATQLRQQFIDWDEGREKLEQLRQQYINGSLTIDQYVVELRSLSSEYQASHPILEAAATSTESLDKKTQALTESIKNSVTARQQAVTVAEQALAQLKAENAGQDQITEATNRLNAARAAQNAAAANALAGINALTGGYKSHIDTAQQLIDKQRNLQDDLAKAETAFRKVQKAVEDGKAPVEALALAEDQLSKIKKQLGADTNNYLDLILKEMALADQNVAKTHALAVAFREMAAEFGADSAEAQTALRMLNAALKATGDSAVTAEGALNLFTPALAGVYGAIAQYGDAAQQLLKTQASLEEKANTAAEAFNQLAAGYERGQVDQVQLGRAFDNLQKAMDTAGISAGDLSVKLNTVGGAIPVITGSITRLQSMTADADGFVRRINASLQELGVTSGSAAKSVDAVSQAATDSQRSVTTLGAAFDHAITILGSGTIKAQALTDSMKTLDEVNRDLNGAQRTEIATSEEQARAFDAVAAAARRATDAENEAIPVITGHTSKIRDLNSVLKDNGIILSDVQNRTQSVNDALMAMFPTTTNLNHSITDVSQSTTAMSSAFIAAGSSLIAFGADISPLEARLASLDSGIQSVTRSARQMSEVLAGGAGGSSILAGSLGAGASGGITGGTGGGRGGGVSLENLVVQQGGRVLGLPGLGGSVSVNTPTGGGGTPAQAPIGGVLGGTDFGQMATGLATVIQAVTPAIQQATQQQQSLQQAVAETGARYNQLLDGFHAGTVSAQDLDAAYTALQTAMEALRSSMQTNVIPTAQTLRDTTATMASTFSAAAATLGSAATQATAAIQSVAAEFSAVPMSLGAPPSPVQSAVPQIGNIPVQPEFSAMPITLGPPPLSRYSDGILGGSLPTTTTEAAHYPAGIDRNDIQTRQPFSPQNTVNIYNPTVTNRTQLDQIVTQIQDAGLNTR